MGANQPPIALTKWRQSPQPRPMHRTSPHRAAPNASAHLARASSTVNSGRNPLQYVGKTAQALKTPPSGPSTSPRAGASPPGSVWRWRFGDTWRAAGVHGRHPSVRGRPGPVHTTSRTLHTPAHTHMSTRARSVHALTRVMRVRCTPAARSCTTPARVDATTTRPRAPMNTPPHTLAPSRARRCAPMTRRRTRRCASVHRGEHRLRTPRTHTHLACTSDTRP